MMCEAHRLVVRRDAASHRIGWGLAVCTSSRGRTVCSLYQLTLRWRWWLGDGSGQQGDCAYTDSRTRASVWLRRGFAPAGTACRACLLGSSGSGRAPPYAHVGGVGRIAHDAHATHTVRRHSRTRDASAAARRGFKIRRPRRPPPAAPPTLRGVPPRSTVAGRR